MNTPTTPIEELRAAAAWLRCKHTFSTRAPHSLWAPGPCGTCGVPYDDAPRDVPEWLREPLAAQLEKDALAARDHLPLPGYAGLPDHRWCVDCQDEECSGLQALDAALVIARVILGGGEKPGATTEDGAW
ncbi:hypothetical protein GCM10017673_37680 [Streptosporangium violaceochromogenes]|nr:hypothetical protein GCM10017673_37680 [Streptosporangium violaceochromogenes]